MTIFVIGISLYLAFLVQADEIEDISRELEKTRQELTSSQKATQNNEVQLKDLVKRLSNIKARVNAVEREIARQEKEIVEGEEKLAEQQVLLDERILSYYKNASKTTNSFMNIFLSTELSKSLNQFFYQKKIMDEDRRAILRVADMIQQIRVQKSKMISEKQKLLPIKEEVAKNSEFLATEINKSKAFEGALQQRIASLSTRQQQLIAQKLSSLNLPQSVGTGGNMLCTDDRKIDPGFSNAFAFYTFGIPHRVGMNQYGAFGRAKAGQDHKTILNTYYNNVRLECRSSPSRTIQVQGFGEVKLEEYLKGIYEMPGSWPIEALKAQVIAARTYALKYTNNGQKEICTTQSCQVYKGGSKGGDWEEAVKQTGDGSCSDGQGLVLISNDTNDLISAWYASTFGGYTLTSGDVGWSSTPWTKRMQDTSSQANSFEELMNNSYDKDSPCLYAAQGSRPEYNKSAWLKSEEVADIVNVLLLAKRDSSTQSHLAQPDKPNPDGTDTWDASKVKEELKSRGGTPFNSISSISVDWDRGSGMTTSINFSGDAGNQSFNANEFKAFFNLRAPANIQIVGPLFNVERR